VNRIKLQFEHSNSIKNSFIFVISVNCIKNNVVKKKKLLEMSYSPPNYTDGVPIKIAEVGKSSTIVLKLLTRLIRRSTSHQR
jgi:hypothetical protein